jgi:hypothetical protein
MRASQFVLLKIYYVGGMSNTHGEITSLHKILDGNLEDNRPLVIANTPTRQEGEVLYCISPQDLSTYTGTAFLFHSVMI